MHVLLRGISYPAEQTVRYTIPREVRHQSGYEALNSAQLDYAGHDEVRLGGVSSHAKLAIDDENHT